MRICAAIWVLTVIAAPGWAGEVGGLPPAMWERVRAAEAGVEELTPTPSPQAPAMLSLKECIRLAFKHNAGFRQDQQDLINARRGLYVADQRLFYTVNAATEAERPVGGTTDSDQFVEAATNWEQLGGGTMALTVGTGEQDVFGDLLTQRPAVSLSYDLPLLRGFGLASSAYEQVRGARTGLESQQLSFYDARQALAVAVVEDYFSVLLAEREVEIARSAQDRAERLYNTNYTLFTGEDRTNPEKNVKEAGEKWVSRIAEIDVDQARQNWEQSKQTVSRQEQSYRDAVDQLLLDMGFVPGATPKLTTQISYTPQEYDEKALVATAVANSTELARLDLSRQDAEAARRIAYSQGKPDLIASVGVSEAGQTLGEQVSAGWFGGLRIEMPLLDRGRGESKARADRALEVLEQGITARRDSVAQNVQSLVRAANGAKDRISLGEESVRLAQKNYEQAQGMYNEGITDFLRVLDADARRVSAERSLLQEQVQYYLITVRMRQALGEEVVAGVPD